MWEAHTDKVFHRFSIIFFFSSYVCCPFAETYNTRKHILNFSFSIFSHLISFRNTVFFWCHKYSNLNCRFLAKQKKKMYLRAMQIWYFVVVVVLGMLITCCFQRKEKRIFLCINRFLAIKQTNLAKSVLEAKF